MEFIAALFAPHRRNAQQPLRCIHWQKFTCIIIEFSLQLQLHRIANQIKLCLPSMNICSGQLIEVSLFSVSPVHAPEMDQSRLLENVGTAKKAGPTSFERLLTPEMSPERHPQSVKNNKGKHE